MRRGSDRGFTLVEVLVSVVLVGVGVASLTAAIGALKKTQALAIDKQAVHGLAMQKLDELLVTGETLSGLEGDFDDQGQPGVVWQSEVVQTGTEGLAVIRVTATHIASPSQSAATVERLLYTPPEIVEAEVEAEQDGPPGPGEAP